MQKAPLVVHRGDDDTGGELHPVS